MRWSARHLLPARDEAARWSDGLDVLGAIGVEDRVSSWDRRSVDADEHRRGASSVQERSDEHEAHRCLRDLGPRSLRVRSRASRAMQRSSIVTIIAIIIIRTGDHERANVEGSIEHRSRTTTHLDDVHDERAGAIEGDEAVLDLSLQEVGQVGPDPGTTTHNESELRIAHRGRRKAETWSPTRHLPSPRCSRQSCRLWVLEAQQKLC